MLPRPLIVVLGVLAGACGDDDAIFFAEEWDVVVTVEESRLEIAATIADVHGDFIHMTVRRDGHENNYTVERSPAAAQPERDWSRVHHWFGDTHIDTYLEGRIDDGSGDGPSEFRTYRFWIPTGVVSSRVNYPDSRGREYEYITRGYSYADGNSTHPSFPPGRYEVALYAWYTGHENDRHPAGERSYEGVQYVHYERPLPGSAQFDLE